MMFPAGQGDGQFRKPFFIDKQKGRYNGEPFFLNLGLQLMEFPFREQQLTVAFGFMVVVGAINIFSDVHADHEKFISPEGAIGINDTRLPFPNRFDFGSGKLDAGREILQKKVFMAGFFIFYADALFQCFYFSGLSTTLT